MIMTTKRVRKSSPLFSPIAIGSIITVCVTSCACDVPRPKAPEENNKEVAAATAAAYSTQTKLSGRAVAVVKSFEDPRIKGQVVFIPVEGGVKIIADLEGLKPGKHGFHIHEIGDCSTP